MALSALTLIQANHRAGKGRSALLKWQPFAEALDAGEPLYRPGGPGAEGYPTLPLSLVVMRPFHALGGRAGALLWAAFQVALAWFIVLSALRLGAGSAREFPGLGALAVLLLSFRVLHSDVQHGNLNVLVGATVVAAARSFQRGRDVSCGVWLALGAVLKATPALLVLWLLRKGSARGLGGFALGVAVFAFLVPGLFLGFARNLDLAGGWWAQMAAPYLAGREVTLLQSEHINQSLLGVLARLFTAAVAVEAAPPRWLEDVRITLVDLGPGGLRALHLAASLACLGFFLACCRGPGERSGRAILGEVSMGAIAMLALSERSWKHHYVLLALPVAFLVLRALEEPRDRGFRLAVTGLGASAILHGLTGSAVLGERGSDLAEAYGAFLLGALVLFVTTGLVLRKPDRYARSG